MNKISAAFAAVFTTTEVEVSMWQGMPLPLASPLAVDGTPNTTLKVHQHSLYPTRTWHSTSCRLELLGRQTHHA
jgi:hypothetical protein